MGRSISPMCETTVTGGSPRAAPRLIVPMSLRLAIPRRVALQQSSPPLHQPTVILKQKERLEKENPLNGKCASFRLSQLRGSPQKPVLLDRVGLVSWHGTWVRANCCDEIHVRNAASANGKVLEPVQSR